MKRRTPPASLQVLWKRPNGLCVCFEGEVVSMEMDRFTANELLTATLVFHPYPDPGFGMALEAFMKAGPPIIKPRKAKRKTK